MEAFSAAELLSIWERCGELDGRGRSSALLQSVCPPGEQLNLRDWTVGQWNAALLDLREAIFGSELALSLLCPHCRERLELQLSVSDLRCGPTRPGELDAQHGDWRARFRLPTLGDLEALGLPQVAADLDAALLRRCLLGVQQGDSSAEDAELPTELVARIDAAMEEADPQGPGLIEVGCMACQRSAQVSLDLGALLWQELDSWAHHLLSDVHGLASAYGWREADVLALSARRRSIYLQLTGL